MKKVESKSIYIVIISLIIILIVGMLFTDLFGNNLEANVSSLSKEEIIINKNKEKIKLTELSEMFTSRYKNSFIKEINYNNLNEDVYYLIKGQDESNAYELKISKSKEVISENKEELEFQSEFKAKIHGLNLKDIEEIERIDDVLNIAKEKSNSTPVALKLVKSKGRLIFQVDMLNGEVVTISGKEKEILKIK